MNGSTVQRPTGQLPRITTRHACIVTTAVAVCVVGMSGPWVLPGRLSVVEAGVRPSEELLAPEKYQQDRSLVELFDRNSPSVVYISTILEDGRPQGIGTGFVWDQDGHIVTNYHVVEGAADVQILKTDTAGRRQIFWVDWIGGSASHDLAVLRIRSRSRVGQFRPMAFGNSNDLRVGQTVHAIGNPLGYQNTLTTGIISGLRRYVPGFNGPDGLIQTDAALNPGNSGGPLLNRTGRVIGVTTIKFIGADNIAFAIPVNTVSSLVLQLIAGGGNDPQSRVGFSVNTDRSRALGVTGVVVDAVLSGTPAYQARIRGGDIIVSMEWPSGKVPIYSVEDLRRYFRFLWPGSQVRLGILRRGSAREVVVTLQ